MRYSIFILLLIFASCKKGFEKAETIPSKVDSLKTEEGVKQYMAAIDSNFNYFAIKKIKDLGWKESPTDDIAKIVALNKGITKNIYKEDFDNNGYTDLLVIGGWGVSSTGFEGIRYDYDFYIVMNYKDKPSEIIPMHNNNFSMTIPEIVTIADEPALNIYSYKKESYTNPPVIDTIIQTLIYRYCGFAEYNKLSTDNHIEKIEFESGSCFGTCPIYTLTINKDKSAEFLAEHYNFNTNKKSYDYLKKEGVFKGNIKTADYENLINLLNYIDFKNLNDSYAVHSTCLPTATLVITYNNGKIKRIEDYGFSGSYGLKSVYKLLADMRFSQKWEKVSDKDSK